MFYEIKLMNAKKVEQKNVGECKFFLMNVKKNVEPKNVDECKKKMVREKNC